MLLLNTDLELQSYKMEEIRGALRQLFLDTDFVKRLQDLLTPGVEAAVSRALEQRDAKIAALEKELTGTKESLTSTKEKLKVTEDKLAAVEEHTERMESENRKNCLVISGVPELPEENIDRLVLDVAQAAGISLSAGEIDRSHRLGRQRGSIDRPRAILVKLLSHNKRQQLFSSRKELSAHRVRDHPVLTSQVLENVFLADFLTSKKQNLLYICRQLKKRRHLWAAYTTNGTVKIRMNENQPAKNINEVADLQVLLGPDNGDLREIAETCRSTTPRSHDHTTAEAAGGPGNNTSPQSTGRPAGDARGGHTTIRGRRQPPRHAGQPR